MRNDLCIFMLSWLYNRVYVFTGAGMSLKVGTQVREKFCRAPPLVFALQIQLVVLVSAFVLVSTVWSVSCLLFLYSRCPRAQPFVKVETRAPRALWSQRR